ncbi:triple gene block protein 1 [Blueberry virus S]|uniref:Triple gene block protein 1 n=1 Tax=Blueberry virus S TaxID=2967988 RepID=A0AAE9N793_9VIRU|nr:triple gene block protein 1 [Blueberry virus S]
MNRRKWISLGCELVSIDMDVLVKYLVRNKFERLSSNLTLPIVVHSVPGAGKSTLIRELIVADSRFSAYTFGKPDQPNLKGVFIKPAGADKLEGEFTILDEYLEGNVPVGTFAVFADPLQGGSGALLRAHFIKRISHRFGTNTAHFLQKLGFEVEAEGEDVVTVADIYKEEPAGVVLYHEKEIGALLANHSVEAYCIKELRGQTFESVTFVTAEQSPTLDRALSFQCLTRHRKSLLILCPDATYTAS